MNIQKMIVSLLILNKIDIQTYKITPDMFNIKQYKIYVNFIQKNIDTHSLQTLNQMFLSKNQNIDIYSPVEVENYLQQFHIKTLLEMFYKQSIQNLIQQKMSIHNTNSSLEEIENILTYTNDILQQLYNDKNKKTAIEEYREYIAEVVTQQEIEGNGTFGGISSGIVPLDQIINGFKMSEYVIIAARPSMGKTSFALDIVAQAIHKNILILSLEMPKKDIVGRLIPKLNNEILLSESMFGENYHTKKEDIQEILDVLEKSNIVIEDFSDSLITMSNIKKAVDNYIQKYSKVDLVVLDYIQLIDSNKYTKDENTHLTNMSRQIKQLCKQTKAPWLVLSQLNRGVENRANKRPTTADLRGSGSLEQDADIILFPYRENVYLEEQIREKLAKNPDNQTLSEALTNLQNTIVENAEIIVGKNRNGPKGSAPVKFHKKIASYMNP